MAKSAINEEIKTLKANLEELTGAENQKERDKVVKKITSLENKKADILKKINEGIESAKTQNDLDKLDRLAQTVFGVDGDWPEDIVNKAQSKSAEISSAVEEKAKQNRENSEKQPEMNSEGVPEGWIKATPEEARKYEQRGILAGYDELRGYVLIKN